MALLVSPGYAQKNVRVHAFDVSASRTWNVFHNGNLVQTANSSTSGAVQFSLVGRAGDTIRLGATGAGAIAPSPPTGLAANGDSVGCAHLVWNANPEADVVGYRVYYANTPGAASTPIDSLSVTDTTAVVCGLADGTWFVAVRARNSAGLLGGSSAEASASVSNGNAQPPLPPQFINASGGAPGCITVSWLPVGDPTVTGYDVSYGASSVASGSASAYDAHVDAGSATSMPICNLSAGTWYVAVRARNYAGTLSAYSSEQAVTLVVTAVAISNFDAVASGSGVELQWDVRAENGIDGFRLLRRLASGGPDVPTGPALLPGVESRYLDHDVIPDTGYEYTLVVVEQGGAETRSAPVQVHTRALILELEQNVPNPFNPTTAISFVLPKSGRVRLSVYDLRGALVATLLDGVSPAGRRSVPWDGRGRDGRKAASGEYFYRLQTPGGVRTRKMILLK